MSYLLREEIPDHVDRALEALPPFIRRLLYHRGITDARAAERFLVPDYERDLHDPFLMKDMDKAVERVKRALQMNERIAVFADYDCDGIPGGTVLHDFFKKAGHENAFVHIPHRYTDGYGLSESALEEIKQDGASLVITVDCGITDVDEVAYANGLGLDVVITDHHLPLVDEKTGKQILPPAYAVVDNKRADDAYPFDSLCGAATAFKLVQALLKEPLSSWDIPEGWEKWLLDMAGLSTIADMVPLTGENRAIAHFGLKVLRKSPRPGLQHLLRKMRVKQQHLTEDDVGFMIAPRINAASRMAEPSDAFHLLATKDAVNAGMLAEHVHELNDRRKGLVAVMIKEARARLERRHEEQGERDVIVLGSPAWMPGLLGLAANKLVEEHQKPVFVWGRNGTDIIKGSCRSDGRVNVVELMTRVETGIFLDFGGHEASGGFSVSHTAVHTLESALLAAYGKLSVRDALEETQWVDAKISLDDLTWELYDEVEKLAPFGIGNPKPAFLIERAEIAGVKQFGKRGEHLEIRLRAGSGSTIPAIAFFTAPEHFAALPRDGERVDVVATLEKSHFRAQPELRLRIVDIV